MNESDPRSNVYYLGSSENKAWKKIQACTGFEPMTSAIANPMENSVFEFSIYDFHSVKTSLTKLVLVV